jgi:hypothetical protein
MEWLNLFYDGFLMAEPISIIAAAIAAATAIAGSVASSAASAKSKKKQQDRERAQEQEYQNDINQDFLNRSEQRAFLRELGQQYQRQNETARRRGIVSGATEEEKLAYEEDKNKQYANALSNMAKGASNFIDNRKSLYQKQQDANTAVWSGIYGQEMQQNANLMNNGINVLGASLGNIPGDGASSKTPRVGLSKQELQQSKDIITGSGPTMLSF